MGRKFRVEWSVEVEGLGRGGLGGKGTLGQAEDSIELAAEHQGFGAARAERWLSARHSDGHPAERELCVCTCSGVCSKELASSWRSEKSTR